MGMGNGLAMLRLEPGQVELVVEHNLDIWDEEDEEEDAIEEDDKENNDDEDHNDCWWW